MKKIILFVLLAFCFTYSYALDLSKGDSQRGKAIFREVCRSCHDGSKTKKISPMHKTMAQWKRFFDNDMARLKEKHPNAEMFKKLSNEDFENIYRFVQDGALDSEQPQTCD